MTDAPKIVALRDHLSTSETTFGLILSGKQTATGFNPEHFAGDYGKMLADLQKGATQEQLVAKYGTTIIQTAHMAAKSVNGLGTELDWREIIASTYKNETIADALNQAKKYLERGDTGKFGETLRRINSTYSQAQRLRSVSADEIDDTYVPFIPSGMEAWDRHIGGFPAVGLVILAGVWSAGKTTNAISLMDCYLRQYPDREVLFVTLEDMNEGWKDRAKIMLGERSSDFWKRIRVMEFASDVSEIIEEASKFENIGLIITDYVDYLADDRDVSSYEAIYKGLSMGAKSLAVDRPHRTMTVVALAQLGKTMYKGGVPREGDIPYTGQQYAYQIMMMYNANSDFHSDNPDNPYVLPVRPGYNYLVSWKVKNGCRPHSGEGEYPGAICLPWTNRNGFAMDNEGEWVSLAPETKRQVSTKRR